MDYEIVDVSHTDDDLLLAESKTANSRYASWIPQTTVFSNICLVDVVLSDDLYTLFRSKEEDLAVLISYNAIISEFLRGIVGLEMVVKSSPSSKRGFGRLSAQFLRWFYVRSMCSPIFLYIK